FNRFIKRIKFRLLFLILFPFLVAGSIKIQSILKSPDRTTNTPKSLQHLPKQGWLLPNWYSYLPKLAGNSQSQQENFPKLAGNPQKQFASGKIKLKIKFCI